MAEILQLLVSGIATGAVYALPAIGFVLLWQTTGTINFAQGEFVMLPSVVILALIWGGVPIWISFAITLIISCAVQGSAFKTVVVQPIIKHGVLPIIISTIALAILMRESAKEFFSNEAHAFPMPVPYFVIEFGGVTLTTHHLFNLAAAFALIMALNYFLGRTKTGRAMQATAQNPETAAVLGINVPRMVSLAYVINAALVTVAALLVTPIYLAKWDNGEIIGLTAFIAAIIGGFNQVRGAILGGVIVGVLENFSAYYVSTQYRTAFPLILLIIVIIWRPYGLMGRAPERTV